MHTNSFVRPGLQGRPFSFAWGGLPPQPHFLDEGNINLNFFKENLFIFGFWPLLKEFQDFLYRCRFFFCSLAGFYVENRVIYYTIYRFLSLRLNLGVKFSLRGQNLLGGGKWPPKDPPAGRVLLWGHLYICFTHFSITSPIKAGYRWRPRAVGGLATRSQIPSRLSPCVEGVESV